MKKMRIIPNRFGPFLCWEIFNSVFIVTEGNICLELIYNAVGVDLDIVKYYFTFFLKYFIVGHRSRSWICFIFVLEKNNKT